MRQKYRADEDNRLRRVRPTRPSLSPTSRQSRTDTAPAKNSQLLPSRSTWSASAADRSCLRRSASCTDASVVTSSR